jgi:hypothetical protein
MLLGGIRGKLLALVLAAVIPFLALIAAGLWSQWQDTKAAAKQRALNDARVLAAQVDDHIGNVEHLLAGLSRAVSSDPADVSRNDALLRQARAELPDFISGIALFSLAGDNIGSSWTINQRTNISDRPDFRAVLAGQLLSIGEVHVGRTTGQWVVNLSRRVEDRTGRTQAVLVIGTRLAHFQDALRVHLELEITENVALDQKSGTVPLQQLRARGVKLALDDFGTGYASLSYLTRLPLSRIKIDRSFVRKITEHAEDAAIVRSLIAMAHNLDLVVVAEGVETEAQAAFLINEKCEEAQGFLYAIPLPASDFEEYIEARQLTAESCFSNQSRPKMQTA